MMTVVPYPCVRSYKCPARIGSVTAATRQRASRELWRWLALGGLAVLMFEGWYYHKRTV